MPYINPGQFIEPYLRPLGKQIIKQIPQIQQEQRAREQLGAQKSVWAEQIAESQANRAVQRDAQARWAELENLPAEAFKGIVPEGIDKDTFLNMIRSGAIKAPTPVHKKELPPVWKEVEYINEQGQRVKKHINVNDPAQQREFPIPTRKVRINGKWMDVRNEVADRIEAMDREELRKDEEFQREQDEKAKNQRIEYLQKKVEWAIAVKSPEMLKYYNGLLDKEVDISSEGIATDPKMDKVRSTVMQANQIIGRYEKIASQDPEDMGAMLASTSQAPVPEKRYLMPPSKKEPEVPKEPTFTEKRGTAKDVAKAEEAIVNPENEGNPAIVGPISIFNRFSDKPYVYIWKTEKQKKGKLWWKKEIETGKTQKIDLPIVNGKQVTAKEVWFTAQENGITMMEVLKLIGAIK